MNLACYVTMMIGTQSAYSEGDMSPDKKKWNVSTDKRRNNEKIFDS